ncbi:unnamed protein product [Allacma fusca]|uniref:Uncharacterized protein n=1 Tax=Allacma fusca TaxID=39272 RepID=A0A8J2KB87_9HEXA|nr:unnamed protein product [Allacma fusca]
MAEVVAIIKRESCSFKSVLQILLFCHLILCGYFMFFALHPMSKEEFILNWFSAGEDVERSWVFRNLFYIVQNKFYFLWMHAAMILVVLGAFKKVSYTCISLFLENMD